MIRTQSYLLIFATTFLAAMVPACDRAPKPVSGAVAATPPARAFPQSREADDTGRFLAGMPGRPGSPFLELEKTDAWQGYRRWLDEAWQKADAGLIANLRSFHKQELDAPPFRDATVFYPFSGPDTLTMTLCFPHSPTYIMVGLEPAGTLPTVKQLTRKELSRYFASMRDTMESELTRSFFITREMDRHFRGQVTDGLLLPILHLLVRTNHTVLGFRYVRLDSDGKVIDRTADYRAPGRIGNKGVEVEFRDDEEQSTHRLFYFSVNLSDERLRENQAFMTYLSRLDGVTTLLKATSYMTHHDEFSTIRSQVMAHSGAVLQDDSGIPFRYFTPDNWKVQLYGSYTRPYGSFRWLEQPDLRKAYETQGPKPLALRIGYGFSKVPSNLLLANRNKPAVARAGE